MTLPHALKDDEAYGYMVTILCLQLRDFCMGLSLQVVPLSSPPVTSPEPTPWAYISEA